jgi:hypothetical protein
MIGDSVGIVVGLINVPGTAWIGDSTGRREATGWITVKGTGEVLPGVWL